MIVQVSQPELEYTGSFGWMDDDGEGWDLSADTMRLSFVNFNVLKSEDSLYYVTVKKYSLGRTEGEAKARAEKLQYTVTYRDSILDLGSGFSIDKNSKFRGQNVEIEIRVPVGKRIRFDESIEQKLNEVRFRNNRGSRGGWYRDRWDFDNDIRGWKTNRDLTMGADGYLSSDGDVKSENAPSGNGEYRYKDNNEPATPQKEDIRKQIEEEKQRQRESEQRIRDLERKAQDSRSTGAPESLDVKDEIALQSPSPVFSLMKSFF
ncbi:MAG: hypothetical protein EOO02_16930 [Chitinophagaceae bacterium]|nr:MAG: hypothetical protein EOO02_16930 [Chitinophagaceae bacterium]